MGEFLDSLRAFGLDFSDRLIRTGIEYLLASQNRDGSWGEQAGVSTYARYHPTWTAIDGLRDYRWEQVLPCPGL
jgi:squalene cyclase